MRPVPGGAGFPFYLPEKPLAILPQDFNRKWRKNYWGLFPQTWNSETA